MREGRYRGLPELEYLVISAHGGGGSDFVDPKQITRLPRVLVKPGGTVVLQVCNSGNENEGRETLGRALSIHWPHAVIRAMSQAAIPDEKIKLVKKPSGGFALITGQYGIDVYNRKENSGPYHVETTLYISGVAVREKFLSYFSKEPTYITETGEVVQLY